MKDLSPFYRKSKVVLMTRSGAKLFNFSNKPVKKTFSRDAGRLKVGD